MFATAKLVPVAQWVYNLYKVIYWDNDPALGGKEIRSVHISASSVDHLEPEAWECAPGQANFLTHDVVKENVGDPRVVGMMYGQKIYETGWSHGRRLSEQM